MPPDVPAEVLARKAAALDNVNMPKARLGGCPGPSGDGTGGGADAGEGGISLVGVAMGSLQQAVAAVDLTMPLGSLIVTPGADGAALGLNVNETTPEGNGGYQAERPPSKEEDENGATGLTDGWRPDDSVDFPNTGG